MTDVRPAGTHVPARMLAALAGLLALTASGIASADAADDGPSGGRPGNTGVSSEEVRVEPLAIRQRTIVDEKDDRAALWVRSFTQASQASQASSPSARVRGRRYTIPAARRMPIVRQRRSYTCGPATLRNMVRVMNKVRHGRYTAPGERRLARMLGTTRDGTSIGSIVNVLNRRFGRFGGWRLANPPGRYRYLAYIATDTLDYKQPVIQGVQTRYLKYYRGWSLNHFTYVYGWDARRRAVKVYIGDAFNPRALGYPSYPVNPYGKHAEPLRRAFKANNRSGPYRNQPRLIV